MIKISSYLVIIMFLLIACHKQDAKLTSEEKSGETAALTQRKCAANELLEAQLAADPSLAKRMQTIEDFTQRVISNPGAYRLVNGVIVIPVVVHVLYNKQNENLGDAQINSQIDVLNEDFNNTNKDAALVPAEFKDEQTSVGIKFVLDRVIRKYTTVTNWPGNHSMKDPAAGGSAVVDPSTYLNMWACSLGDNLLGFATFPGGPSSIDGVVILNKAFGRTGSLDRTFNKGRTATHEVGHWMNLRHIWGDKNCGNDLVDDTPPAAIYNFGCPSYPQLSTCKGNGAEMTMNYMDYTDDACMYMFTTGQRDRMLATFAGVRASMATP
jgi:hypothetical protein